MYKRQTLARDLKILCEEKYELIKWQTFDQFSHTTHVEKMCIRDRGYTFTYDLFEGTVNQDITDFETTADISGGDYTVIDPSGS